jgi:hypothetical protein
MLVAIQDPKCCMVVFYKANFWRPGLHCSIKPAARGSSFSYCSPPPYIVWRRAREPILPVSGYSYIKLFVSSFNSDIIRTQNTHKHPCLSGIRTHDPNVGAGEDSSFLTVSSAADTFAIYREENYLHDFSHQFRYVALPVEIASTNRKEY